MEYSEEVKKSHFIDILQKVCADKNCHIATGFNEHDGNRIYNSALLINEKGVVGKYRKIHLFMNEKDYFTPGDESPKIFEILGWRVGMLICFDWAFPELWRSLALKGADIIAHPANFILEEYATKAVPVHAMLNRYYVVTSNRIGTEDELTFTGGSFIPIQMVRSSRRQGKNRRRFALWNSISMNVATRKLHHVMIFWRIEGRNCIRKIYFFILRT
jgi:predicted amidohydrolase